MTKRIWPKKALGQHFLVQPAIAEKIARALTGKEYRKIVEVGPGKGILTNFLVDLPFDLTCVEIDPECVEYLEGHFQEQDFNLVKGDFLRTDLLALTENEPFALVGNFPYQISSQIVFRMLSLREYIPELTGMFQKEMAARIVARPGNKDFGVITVLTQCFYRAQILFHVKPGSFYPPPKVNSSVIQLRRKENPELPCQYKTLRNIVKAAFSQRRKMLRNTLKNYFPEAVLREEPLFTKRPEKLSVRAFIDLAKRAEDMAGK